MYFNLIQYLLCVTPMPNIDSIFDLFSVVKSPAVNLHYINDDRRHNSFFILKFEMKRKKTKTNNHYYVLCGNDRVYLRTATRP